MCDWFLGGKWGMGGFVWDGHDGVSGCKVKGTSDCLKRAREAGWRRDMGLCCYG